MPYVFWPYNFAVHFVISEKINTCIFPKNAIGYIEKRRLCREAQADFMIRAAADSGYRTSEELRGEYEK